MKKIIFIVLGIIVLIATAIAFSPSNSGGLLGSQDFMNKYNSNSNAILVDVRTPAEFEAGHIQGAINVDYENSNFGEEVQKLDKTKDYFIYCRSGNRSSKSVPIMKNSGIKNIYDLEGGISKSPELLKL